MNNDLENLNKRDIETDIMKYKNNKASFLLCILAIILDVIMFLSFYETTSCVPNFEMGIDLIVNVLFLLACFLGAEKNKVYDKKWAIILFIIAGLQILRIFWIPTKYFNIWLKDNKLGLSMAKYIFTNIMLILSSVSLVFSGVITLFKHKRLEDYNNKFEERK